MWCQDLLHMQGRTGAGDEKEDVAQAQVQRYCHVIQGARTAGSIHGQEAQPAQGCRDHTPKRQRVTSAKPLSEQRQLVLPGPMPQAA